MTLQRAGDMLSSDNTNTVDNINCVSPEDTVGDLTQGTIKGDQFVLGLAIDNGTPNAQGVRFTGVVAKSRATSRERTNLIQVRVLKGKLEALQRAS